ncbi:MAG: GTP pyrophosphokinase family protein [Lachnospiraceae bacterium]|nr:GTP pyrophosphokinase family protein [Lachnospiraceae bacterium]
MNINEMFEGGPENFETLLFLYNSALKKVHTKIDVLRDEFIHIHNYNPIEYIKDRIKSPNSIKKKLEKHGQDITYYNMVENVNDIAGIRIVCSFFNDIYRIAGMIGRQTDLTVLSIKDYLKNPKPSGYSSYHMLVTVPIFLSQGTVDVKVEIQIRTIAMDFWASLEHKIYYKFEGNAPEYISRDLKECANIVAMLDRKMLELNDAVNATRAGEEEEIEIDEDDEVFEEYESGVEEDDEDDDE